MACTCTRRAITRREGINHDVDGSLVGIPVGGIRTNTTCGAMYRYAGNSGTKAKQDRKKVIQGSSFITVANIQLSRRCRSHDTLHLQLQPRPRRVALGRLPADHASFQAVVAHGNALEQQREQTRPLSAPNFARVEAPYVQCSCREVVSVRFDGNVIAAKNC